MKESKPHDRQLVPVLFMTFTERNCSSKAAMFREVEHFCQQLSNFTRTHIEAGRGYQTGDNTHEHGIALVPKNEVQRFWSRFAKFNHNLVRDGRWITREQMTQLIKKKCETRFNKSILELAPFDTTKTTEAFHYVMAKHEPVLSTQSRTAFCPRYYSRCKRGKCDYANIAQSY